MLLELLARVSQHNELTHDLLIVHTGDASHFELEALFMKIESTLVVVLVSGDDSQVQIYLGNDSITDLLGCSIYFQD